MKRTDCNVLAFVATLGMVLAGCKDRGPANAIAATAPAGGAGGGAASPGLQVPAEAFTLRLNSRLALGGHSLVANVEATLAASTAWKRGDEIWRSFRLTSPKVLLAAGKDEQKELPGLERPFALRFSKTGSLEELAVHEDIPVETRRVLQTLAGFFQFVCTEDEASKRWTVLENDGTGSYRASYERDDNGWVTKNKLSYDGDLVIRLRVERSQSSYRARCNEFPDEISAVEHLTGSELGMDAHTTLRMVKLASPSTLPEQAVGKLASGLRRHAPSEVSALAPRDTKLAGQKDIALEAAIAELEPSNTSIFPLKISRSLMARLRDQPAELAVLEHDFRANAAHRHALSRLLVGVDTVASRKLTDELLEDVSLPEEAHVQLLTALLFAPSVEKATIDRLHTLGKSKHDRLASAAVNTEGALLKRAEKQGTFDVAGLKQRYVQQAAKAKSARTRSAYLHGLSYIGDEVSLEALEAAVEDPGRAVRVSAVSALERVDDPRADTWIVKRIHADPEPEVRERSLLACAYRASAPCAKALLQAVLTDKSARVRARAVEVLAQAGSAKLAEPVLRKVVKSDADPKVRKIARGALERVLGGGQSKSGKSMAPPASSRAASGAK